MNRETPERKEEEEKKKKQHQLNVEGRCWLQNGSMPKEGVLEP